MRKRITICLKVKDDDYSRLSPGFVCLIHFLLSLKRQYSAYVVCREDHAMS